PALAAPADQPLCSMGKRKCERAASTWLTLDPDSAPLQLGILLGQGEAEARPLSAVWLVLQQLMKLFENSTLVFGCDSYPLVMHRYSYFVVDQAGGYVDALARRRELHRVG